MDLIITGQWQWQSNPNSEWTFYSFEQNYLIEKARFSKKNEVDLGDSILYFEEKLTRNNADASVQRLIRWIPHTQAQEIQRLQINDETIVLNTMNNVFRSFEDFFNFLSKRNHEILHFSKLFEKAEETKNMEALNKEILPKLLDCFEKELKKIDSKESEIKEKLARENLKVTSMFQKDFASFDEFYGSILKAFTMDSFLCRKLNQYLRNEDCIELDTLLPYLVCFCKAFFYLKSSPTSNPAILYRGATLDQSALSQYHHEKVKYFTWNGITSTSKSKDAAQNFMVSSAKLTKKHDVLFIIEVPKLEESESKYSRYLDMESYSAFPAEKEVLLPPGSVFELLDVSKNSSDNQTTIRLRFVGNFEDLKSQGILMLRDEDYEISSSKQANAPKDFLGEDSLRLEITGPVSKGIWQWKSEAGFCWIWRKTEWKSYSFDHSELIEEAYLQENKRDVEIDNEIISLIDFVRYEKRKPKIRKQIRRICWTESEEREIIIEEHYDFELTKKIKDGFGSINNFLAFIKVLGGRSFAEAFEKIEASNDIAKLNREIIPQLLAFFQDEVNKASSERPGGSIISSLINSVEAQTDMSDQEKIWAIQNIIKFKMEKKCKELIQAFAKEFKSFQDFYACILKVYTMGTFLDQNLNRYIREETWSKLHALLPFLFCLCKAFSVPK